MLQKSEKAHTLYGEPQATDSIAAQRLMAEETYLRAKTIFGLFGRAIRWATGVAKAYLVTPVTEGIRLRRTYRELMALDDHMLADIGLSRHEIPQAVARSAVRGGSAADVHVITPAQGPTHADETERPLAA